MKILMMATADYAAVEPKTGKLNVIGVFRRINAPSFPSVHPRLYVVIQIEGELADSRNPHNASMTIADEDGRTIVAIETPFELPKAPPGIPPQQTLVLELNGFVFHHAGDYVFATSVNDGEAIASTVVQVVGP